MGSRPGSLVPSADHLQTRCFAGVWLAARNNVWDGCGVKVVKLVDGRITNGSRLRGPCWCGAEHGHPCARSGWTREMGCATRRSTPLCHVDSKNTMSQMWREINATVSRSTRVGVVSQRQILSRSSCGEWSQVEPRPGADATETPRWAFPPSPLREVKHVNHLDKHRLCRCNLPVCFQNRWTPCTAMVQPYRDANPPWIRCLICHSTHIPWNQGREMQSAVHWHGHLALEWGLVPGATARLNDIAQALTPVKDELVNRTELLTHAFEVRPEVMRWRTLARSDDSMERLESTGRDPT